MFKLDEETIRATATAPATYKTMATISFLESAFLPVPVDAITMPMMLGAPSKAFRVANIAIIASILGGILGYLIGYFFYETIGKWLIETLGYTNAFEEFRCQAQEDWMKAALAIFIGAVTPIPFKLVCLGAGVLKISFPLFLLVAITGRAIRFYIFAIAFTFLGRPVRNFALKHMKLVGAGALIVMLLGFAAIYMYPGKNKSADTAAGAAPCVSQQVK